MKEQEEEREKGRKRKEKVDGGCNFIGGQHYIPPKHAFL